LFISILSKREAL